MNPHKAHAAGWRRVVEELPPSKVEVLAVVHDLGFVEEHFDFLWFDRETSIWTDRLHNERTPPALWLSYEDARNALGLGE